MNPELDLLLDRQRRMLAAATPLIMSVWKEARAMSAEERSAKHCGTGDLVAQATVGPAAMGGQVEVAILDRELVLGWIRQEKGLVGCPADQKLCRSALEYMRSAPAEVAMQAMMPVRTEDALWVVLEDGRQVIAIVCLSYPMQMAPGGDA